LFFWIDCRDLDANMASLHLNLADKNIVDIYLFVWIDCRVLDASMASLHDVNLLPWYVGIRTTKLYCYFLLIELSKNSGSFLPTHFINLAISSWSLSFSTVL
jgi:hypothetical protein